MRITVGHVVIIGVVGAGGYFASTKIPSPENYFPGTSEWSKEVRSWIGLLNRGPLSRMIGDKERHEDGSISSVAVSTANVPTTQAVEQAASNLTEVVPPVIALAQANPPVATATMKNQSKNYSRKTKSKRRKASRKKTTEGTPSSDNGARETSAADNLLDSYVVLEMKSGQKIQGVLKEITATSYVIELPGMGPFPYLIEKVKSIAAVQ